MIIHPPVTLTITLRNPSVTTRFGELASDWREPGAASATKVKATLTLLQNLFVTLVGSLFCESNAHTRVHENTRTSRGLKRRLSPTPRGSRWGGRAGSHSARGKARAIGWAAEERRSNLLGKVHSFLVVYFLKRGFIGNGVSTFLHWGWPATNFTLVAEPVAPKSGIQGFADQCDGRLLAFERAL